MKEGRLKNRPFQLGCKDVLLRGSVHQLKTKAVSVIKLVLVEISLEGVLIIATYGSAQTAAPFAM
jgi:hypothetical protein